MYMDVRNYANMTLLQTRVQSPDFFMQNFYPSELVFMWIFMHADFIALFLLSKKKSCHEKNIMVTI